MIDMNWTDLANDWNSNLKALIKRFPYAQENDLTSHKDAPGELTEYLAQSHHLTHREAREEMETWLFVQGLAREAADLRSHDAHLVAAE
jgi:hypothetical protein